MDIISILFGFALWLLINPLAGIFVYCVPLTLALLLKKENWIAITLLNVFFGWIFPLWIALLLWSMLGVRVKEDIEPKECERDITYVACKHCEKLIDEELTHCSYCGKEQMPIE